LSYVRSAITPSQLYSRPNHSIPKETSFRICRRVNSRRAFGLFTSTRVEKKFHHQPSLFPLAVRKNANGTPRYNYINTIRPIPPPKYNGSDLIFPLRSSSKDREFDGIYRRRARPTMIDSKPLEIAVVTSLFRFRYAAGDLVGRPSLSPSLILSLCLSLPPPIPNDMKRRASTNRDN